MPHALEFFHILKQIFQILKVAVKRKQTKARFLYAEREQTRIIKCKSRPRLLGCFAHPGRHGLTHAMLERETKSAVTLEAAVVSQLPGGEGMPCSYSLMIETDEMIDAQVVDISIVTDALTGEIVA